jgi:hypothetical protein
MSNLFHSLLIVCKGQKYHSEFFIGLTACFGPKRQFLCEFCPVKIEKLITNYSGTNRNSGFVNYAFLEERLLFF